ncbi:hypothetical protein DET59_10475 [Rossellomorea aquimaris]|uniref:Lipoprotein n=1 Tax=Rossellomorea aquimaris TaxID=189382 RepID=A0A366ESI8_9BACI|nr:hypothetical protein DET59_10475 [Rossellomorea aquimaris]
MKLNKAMGILIGSGLLITGCSSKAQKLKK